MSEPFIVAENLVKIYQVAELEVIALQGLELTINKSEMVGIVGTSGSGKSTFLNVLGGLIQPSAGKMMVGGRDLLKATPAELDSYRAQQVGFIWQQSARNLLPFLTARENVELPMTVAHFGFRQRRRRSEELLKAVGLWEHRKHRLAQLSGGQQQRVAIAVALANNPTLLLGDEPTGELDSKTADEILALLEQLNEQFGLTTVIVSHDQQIARAVGRVVTIRDGRTSSETIRRAHDQNEAASFDEYVVIDNVGRLQLPPDLRGLAQMGERATLTMTDEGHILIKAANKPVTQTSTSPLPCPDNNPPTTKRRRRFWQKKQN